MPQLEQKLLTLLEYLSSLAKSLVFCVVVCPLSFCLAIVLSVFRLTASHYAISILKLFYVDIERESVWVRIVEDRLQVWIPGMFNQRQWLWNLNLACSLNWCVWVERHVYGNCGLLFQLANAIKILVFYKTDIISSNSYLISPGYRCKIVHLALSNYL